MTRFLALFLLFAACSDDDAEPIQLSNGESTIEVSPDGMLITLSRSEALLHFPADAFQLGLVNAIEEDLSYDPYWLELDSDLFQTDPPKGLRWREVTSAEVTRDGDDVIITHHYGSSQADLRITKNGTDRFLLTWVPTADSPIAWMRLRPRSDEAEAFYGLGEVLDQVNQRGMMRSMQMEADLEMESAANELHVPVPLLIGTNGWGLFVESRRYGLFDVARKEEDLVEVTYGTAEESHLGLSFHLFTAAHPIDITNHYYQVTTYPTLPAEWAYGPWIWRDENRDQAEVLDDIRLIRQLDLATSAIWIDRPYATDVNTFDFHPTHYPDPQAMIDHAHAQGLRMALWHTPYVAEGAGALRQEAEDRHFFPITSGMQLNPWSDPIDLSNPDAYAWWQSSIRRYTDMGIEGFKLDYAEDVLPGVAGSRNRWAFNNGEDELTMHYDYTLLYHQVYAETLPDTGGFLLCRTGRWGDQKYASVIWPGDLDADFSLHRDTIGSQFAVGGLPASVIMGLSLGPSGFPFFAADTGGYRHSPPDNETFIRWFQQTALSSIMEVGDSSSQPPWVFNAENGRTQATLDLYREYARLHLRLFPYAWTYAERIKTDGRPIQRALGLAHPELEQHPDFIYLFGEHLLVAPVVTLGASNKEVIFPKGQWRDWWTNETFEGGQTVTVAAPLAKLPLFLRAGGIVPMLRPDIDTLSPTTTATIVSYANDPGPLTVRIAPGPATTFTVFDGTQIAHEENGTVLDFTPGTKFQEGVLFEVIGDATQVELGGSSLSETSTQALSQTERGWAQDEGIVYIKLPNGTHQVVITP